MLISLRHITCIFIAILLIGCLTSCQSWREAKTVVAEADSLLLHKKTILRDTAALNFAINTLDGPLGYIFAKQDLAKAYYFMGRNFYYLNDFSTAADYYILCDRLNPKDPLYKGRVNSCMGYLCKQDSCFEEALVFYERSSSAFKESGSEWYYAHNLLNIAEQYVNMREYAKADSVLDIAKGYEIDSAYYARMVDVKALALYNQEMYDSALVYLLCIKDYPRPMEARCFNNVLIIRCYNKLKNPNAAISYAEYIIAHSKNPAYRSNAYFILIQSAGLHNDVNQLSKCSNAREDEDRILRHSAELHAQATVKLRTYLDETSYTYIIVLIIASCVGLLGCGIWFTYKRHCRMLQKHAKEKQDRRDLLVRRIYDHSIYFTSNKVWQDYKKLREFANSHFDNMFYKLEDAYHLSEQEMKICLMVLLEYSNKQMAEILFVQPNTISKAKSKIAKQLNTSSTELRASLLGILA